MNQRAYVVLMLVKNHQPQHAIICSLIAQSDDKTVLA
jgi:hypothetical protein